MHFSELTPEFVERVCRRWDARRASRGSCAAGRPRLSRGSAAARGGAGRRGSWRAPTGGGALSGRARRGLRRGGLLRRRLADNGSAARGADLERGSEYDLVEVT